MLNRYHACHNIPKSHASYIPEGYIMYLAAVLPERHNLNDTYRR